MLSKGSLCKTVKRVKLLLFILGKSSFLLFTADCFAQSDTVVQPVAIDSIKLGEVVVKARSRALISNSGRGIINLSSQKFSQIPSVLGATDVIKVLQLMPGVQHSGEGNGYLYVRGADPGHNLFLYNSVPVYGMSHLLGIFPFYNSEHIDRLHFDKSGSEAQFGNRLGATVQCLSPDIAPDSFAVKGNAGLIATQLTLSSPLGRKAGMVISGRQTYVDKIITPLIYNSAKNEKSIDRFGYSFTDANFTLLLRPGERHNIDVNIFASGDRFNITDSRMLLDGKIRWSNQTASVNWNVLLDGDVKLSHEVYVSRYANNLQVSQASLDLQIDSEVCDWGYQGGADFKLYNIPFMAGIQYSNYRIRPQKLSSEHLPFLWETDNTGNAQLVSAYVHGKPQLGKRFSLDLGLRAGLYAGNDKTADFRLEPRVSLNFSDNNRWTAYVSYSRKCQRLHLITTSSVGFPTDFWIASAEGIPVELADNFSIGSNYKAFLRLEITAGMFYSRMFNLLQYPFSVTQFNEITGFSNDLFTGKGNACGAELMVKKTGRLSGWTSYTWSKSNRQFDEIDNGQTFPSKFDRRHNLSLAVHYEISKRWAAGLTQVFTSGNRFTAPTSWYFINNSPVKEYGRYNNAKMPDYKRTDVSVDYYLKKTVRRESAINLSVYNLFAIDNPVYVLLDVKSSDTGNKVQVWVRHKSMYSILPSIGWRFRF
jgi:hypothetical protein